jgi:hypothetical protein
MRLTLSRSLSPANDQRLLASAPITHLPGWVSTTRPGPALHFSVPSFLPLVALGTWNTGPMPQVILSVPDGDR